MELLIAAGFILATFLILLAVSLGRREPNEVTVDVTRSGNGGSQEQHNQGGRY